MGLHLRGLPFGTALWVRREHRLLLLRTSASARVGWPDRTAVGHPHVEHVIDTEVRVFEQMCSLGVYLKGVVVIKMFWVQ